MWFENRPHVFRPVDADRIAFFLCFWANDTIYVSSIFFVHRGLEYIIQVNDKHTPNKSVDLIVFASLFNLILNENLCNLVSKDSHKSCRTGGIHLKPHKGAPPIPPPCLSRSSSLDPPNFFPKQQSTSKYFSRKQAVKYWPVPKTDTNHTKPGGIHLKPLLWVEVHPLTPPQFFSPNRSLKNLTRARRDVHPWGPNNCSIYSPT